MNLEEIVGVVEDILNLYVLWNHCNETSGKFQDMLLEQYPANQPQNPGSYPVATLGHPGTAVTREFFNGVKSTSFGIWWLLQY